VLGLLALSEGDAETAAAELAEGARLLHEMGVAHPGEFPALPDAVEALASTGDLELGELLLRRLERQAAALDSGWPDAASGRSRGAFLLARGETEDAAAVLRDAAERFDLLGYRPDAARAVLLCGRALLRGGHRTLAADTLVDARERFAAMGASLWEARAVEELERASPGRAAGMLTENERRVAALVAQGLRNRQIGEELFMSTATVEAHLTRIYRKLGVRSRSELARLIADKAFST
jgi:DNA-binding NarL/FixJ family response regulator